MERRHELARIDEILRAEEIKDSLNSLEILESRIKEHVDRAFRGQDLSGKILKQFYVDIRLQVTLDKARVLDKGMLEPDIKVQIMFGGIFGQEG